MQDPRFRNEKIAGDSVSSYFANYIEKIRMVSETVDPEQIEAAFSYLLKAVDQGRRIYVAGNGGSCAIADHLCCDWMKGTRVSGEPALMVHSLSSNTSLLTALANDYGYENSFSMQVEMLCKPGDVLVLISSSGNSPNIVNAAETARAKDVKVIGLTGFSGGKIANLADVSLHVQVDNYGVVEDSHQILMHVLAQYLAKARDCRHAQVKSSAEVVVG
jgi:phosphoheptose isomerase